jgi:hypothetical protein
MGVTLYAVPGLFGLAPPRSCDDEPSGALSALLCLGCGQHAPQAAVPFCACRRAALVPIKMSASFAEMLRALRAEGCRPVLSLGFRQQKIGLQQF